MLLLLAAVSCYAEDMLLLAGIVCVVGDVERKSSGGVDSLEALGKSLLEQSLAKVTTTADWKTSSSTVTLVRIHCQLSASC